MRLFFGQEVGYLEDGTMVVVNGGGDFIGEILKLHLKKNFFEKCFLQ